MVVLLMVGLQSVFAQEREITGVVTSADDGLTIPGVSVVVKGTTNGASTDIDGKYKLKVSADAKILVFSFVGMETQEIAIEGKTTINVVLKSAAKKIDEVVVVGYTTTTKQSFSGTAKVVEAEKLTSKAVQNVSQALAGESAGVQVINNGQPGQTATILIRGIGSVNGNSAPLYIVDGVPFSGDLNSINAEDVKSTTILKDASATAIYGSRGANGVILITTKKGRAGKTSFEVNAKHGWNFRLLPRYERITSPEEYLELSYDALKNDLDKLGYDMAKYKSAGDAARSLLFDPKFGFNPIYNMWQAPADQLIDPVTGKMIKGLKRKYTPEDWGDYAYQTSSRDEVTLKMSGGSEKASHYISMGYLKDVGYALNSDYTRFGGRVNLAYKPTEWLRANTNLNYSYGEQNKGTGGGAESLFWVVDNMPSIYPLFVRDAEGNIVKDKYYGNNKFDYGETSERAASPLSNGISSATYDLDRVKKHSISANMSFVATITKGLTFETSYGLDYYSRVRNNVGNPFFGGDAGEHGAIYKTYSSIKSQNFNQILRFRKTFDVHGLEAFVAHESNEYVYEVSTVSKKGIVNITNDEARESLSNYIAQGSDSQGYYEDRALESYFGQVSYNYDRKYYLTGTVRRDGSSRFYNDKWGTFWSVGASWVASNEDFMKSIEAINFLKVKASYGHLGDERSASEYAGQNGYNIGTMLDAKGKKALALELRATDNPYITWESSNQFQFGVEFEAFNGFLEGAVDYYSKSTSDLVFSRRVAPSTGDALIDVNDGKLLNSGIEFDLTANVIKTDDLKFSVSVNGEMLHNELTQMPLDGSGKRKISDAGTYFCYAKGKGLYDYFIPEWAGVNSANGDPLWKQSWVDKNNNNMYDEGEGIKDLYDYRARNPKAVIKERITNDYAEATSRFIGKSAIPTVRGAFRLNLSYKGFTLGAQFAYSLGGYAYDGAYAGSLMGNSQIGAGNYSVDMRKRWRKPGDITNVPRLYATQNTRVNATSTRFLVKSDYLALNNVRLGYSLPKAWVESLGLNSIDVWASGDNLFLLSERKGFNPASSVTGNSSSYRYQPMSSVTLGTRIKF